MRVELGDEFKLDGVPVKIIAEDVSGGVFVVMDIASKESQRIDSSRFILSGQAEFRLK